MNKDGGLSHKLHGLDHLRAFAISFVFLFHYSVIFQHPQWTNTVGKFGWTGVDLFFVLSGYLIASQLFYNISAQHTISLKEFFIKRIFRIFPAYFFVVIIYFSFPFAREHEALAPLWKYLTFTQNIDLDLRTQGTFSHAWSLCIEEQFYLLLPLMLVAFIQFKLFKKAFWLLISLFVFGFIIRIYSYNHFVKPHINDDDSWLYWHKYIYYPSWCRLDGLLTGISVAALLQFKPKFKEWILQFGNWLFIISILVLSVAYFVCLNEQSFGASIFGFPLVSFGYGIMILAALSPKCFLYKYQSKVTTKIASLSFGIYLIHKIIIHITQTQFTKINIEDTSNFMFLICIATVFIASLILNETIEKPFLHLRKKILKKENSATNNKVFISQN